MRTVLERYGYRVHEAASGEECLERLAELETPIHLLLTDVVMSGMDGHQLATAVTALRPDMKVLYMSGYSDDVMRRHGLSASDICLIKKPVPVMERLARVRQALDG